MKLSYASIFALTAASAALLTLLAQAQQPVPAEIRTGVTPKGITWPSPMIPDGPINLETGVERTLKIVVTKGLNQPFGMAFLPDGSILITERPGRLRIVKNGVLQPDAIPGTPQVQAQGLGGLEDIALHPRFAENGLIYFTYHKPPPPTNGKATGSGIITLGRGRWNGSAITGFQELFATIVSGNASRLIFGRDGMVYMSVGSGDPPIGQRAQDPNDLAGKILRLRDDGTVPPDNPFVGRAGYRPEIYTMGHRIPLGLAINPVTGSIWECENGPNGGDEVNILQAGKNYGWPLVSYGTDYDGTVIPSPDSRADLAKPAIYWAPVIAPGNITFYNGAMFPDWNGSMLIGGMATKVLARVTFDGKGGAKMAERWDVGFRVRDLAVAADGSVWLVEDAFPGGLYKLTKK